jgi:hypothetical protein
MSLRPYWSKLLPTQVKCRSIDWDAKTLVEGELEAGKQKATVKDGKMLVTGKIRCLACPTVLTNKVSGSGEIRDKLRLLVRGHLDEKVSLLELDYQPFKI